jgi:hypothetical protein
VTVREKHPKAERLIADLLELCEARPQTIRVGRTYHGGFGRASRVPFIRLAGRWLEELGFTEGTVLDVIVGPGEIRLVRQEETRERCEPQSDLFGGF